MTWTLSFPGSKEAEPYENLETWPDVMQAVREELATSIRDMGSDGYDLAWPQRALDVGVETYLENLPISSQEEAVSDAHELGIDRAVAAHLPSVEAKLSTVGEARLPDMTWIKLSEGDNDA